MTSKTILAIFGDTQIGSSTAIAPPKFTIHNNDPKETQVNEYNPLQAWLWEDWKDFTGYIKHVAGVRGLHRKHRIVVVHLGDVIDGNHHGTKQIIQDVGDQIICAKQILEPLADMADNFFGIYGTEAHSGALGADEKTIYEDIGATEYGYNLSLKIDGKIHDFAHHGRVGRRDWTSVAASIGVEVLLDYGATGTPYPDFIWRAHNHIIDDSGDKLPGTRVICLPSWQLQTSFVHRISPNKMRSDIGGYIVDGGVVDNSRSRYKGQPNGRRIIEL